jgi:Phosphodiester glycosidase
MSSLGLRRALGFVFALSSFAAGASARADVTHPHSGVTLVRHSGQSAMAIVDLCAAGVSVRATKYGERQKTPQQWGESVGVQVAMNADFFDFPGWTYVVGRARGAGEEWPANAQQKEGRPFWEFGPGIAEGHGDGGMAPAAGVTEIVGGHNVIIAGGNTTGPWADANDGQLLNTSHARSAIGRSADRRTLYMMSTSASISASTLVDWLQQSAAEAGAPHVDWATNQDGGGSSQLYVQNLGQVISTGRQVNNHLGIYATGNGAPTMCSDHAPRGYLDSAGCDVIKGWSQDEDKPDEAVTVALGFDGTAAQPAHTAQVSAGLHRDDLCAAIASCNHGYEMLPPLSLFDGTEHPVFARGLDIDGPLDAELGSSPRTMKCDLPALKGVIRHVVSPDSYASWGFVGFLDQLSIPDAALAALSPSYDLPVAPLLVQAEGEPEVWLVDGLDGSIRRHVPDPTVAARWHLDLGKVEKHSKEDIATLTLGPPLRERPTLVKSSGPAVYLLDDDLNLPVAPDGGSESGAGGGGGNGGAGGLGGASGASSAPDASCSCEAAGASKGGAGAGVGMGIAAMIALSWSARRRR